MRNVSLQRANTSTNGPGPRDRPRSSDRVLQLLAAVGAAPNGLSLTEAALAVGLVPSTALRQLRSLEAAGMVVRGSLDQVYRSGPQLVELARTVFVGHSLASVAQPFLDRLAADTGESAYLAVAERARTAAYIATAPGLHALRHSGWLGRGFNSTSTAAGAALHGKVDADGAIAREGRLEPGITAVSAPVRSSDGIVAAISVVGPSFRLTGAQLDAARIATAGTAAALSHALGFHRQG